MSNVEFDNDNKVYKQQTSFNRQNNSRGITGWLLKTGIIKDESQAGSILTIIVIINFAITAWLFYKYVLWKSEKEAQQFYASQLPRYTLVENK